MSNNLGGKLMRGAYDKVFTDLLLLYAKQSLDGILHTLRRLGCYDHIGILAEFILYT